MHIFFIRLKYLFKVKLYPYHYCKLCGILNGKLICKDCVDNVLIDGKTSYCGESNNNFFDKCYPAYHYKNPIRKLLHHFKYKKQQQISWYIGYLWYINCTSYDLTHIDYIIPVPQSKHKYKSRGFNQVKLMLEYYMAVNNQIPIMSNLVAKLKDNKTQVSQTLVTRYDNVRGSFKVTGALKGKKILLVDDVFTTGATVNEISRVLKEAGALQVDIMPLMYVSRFSY